MKNWELLVGLCDYLWRGDDGSKLTNAVGPEVEQCESTTIQLFVGQGPFLRSLGQGFHIGRDGTKAFAIRVTDNGRHGAYEHTQ